MPVAKKTSKKRKAAFVLFLIIVTLVVLYSYCYGKSICYTMPLFTDWSRVTLTETKHGLVLTSSVVLKTGVVEKQGNYRGETNGKTKLTQNNENTTVYATSPADISFDGESDDIDNTNNPSGLSGSGFPVAMSGISGEVDFVPFVHPIRPPSDITGKVADEILKAANISTAEAERGLVRVKRPLKKPIDITGKVAERILRQAQISQKEAEKELIRIKRTGKKDKKKTKNGLVEISENNAEGKPKLKSRTEINGNARKTVNLAKLKSFSDDKELLRVKRLDDDDDGDDGDDGDDNVKDDEDNNSGSGILRNDFANVNTSRPIQQGVGSFNATITKKRLTLTALSVIHTPVKKFEWFKNGKIIKHQLENSSHFPFVVYNKTTAVTLKNNTELNMYHELEGNLPKLVITHKSLNISKMDKNQTREIRKKIQTEYKGRNASNGVKIKKFEKHDFSSSKTYSMHPLGQLLSNLESLKEHIKSNPDNISIENKNPSISVRMATNASKNHTFQPTRKLLTFTDDVIRQQMSLNTSISNITISSKGAGTDKKPQRMRSKLINSRSIFNTSRGELQSMSTKSPYEFELHSKTTSPSVWILKANMTSTNLRKAENASLKTLSNREENEKPSDIQLNSTTEGSAELLDKTPLNPSTDGAIFRSGSGSGSELVWGSDVDIEGEFDDIGSTRETDRIVRPTILTPLTLPRQPVSTKRKTADDVKKRLTNQSLSNGLLTYDVLSCDPLEPAVLLFNRIFKTGSSTTEFFIKKASRPLGYSYHLGTTEDWYDKSKSRLYPGLIVRKAAQKLTKATPRMAFVAHFYFRKYLKLQRTHTYINQVREPIRRVISHYYYMRSRKRPKERIKRFFKSKEFNETLEECFKRQHTGCESNVMTRFFCGTHIYCRTGSNKALLRAIYNIKHFYGVVGLLEQYDTYLRILHKRFPRFFTLIKSPSNVRVKSNPEYDISNVSDKLKQIIKQANWADVKLYEFIRERFMKQARTCGITLDH